MNEVKKCPKCSGEMIKGSKENLEGKFACTRSEPEPEAPQNVKVQSYYCQRCGFMEFYRELTAERNPRVDALLEVIDPDSYVQEETKEHKEKE